MARKEQKGREPDAAGPPGCYENASRAVSLDFLQDPRDQKKWWE